jgi:hypothetical protein
VALYSASSGDIHTCLHALVFDVVPAHTQIYSTEPNRMGVVQMPCGWTRACYNEGQTIAVTPSRRVDSMANAEPTQCAT